MTPDRVTMIAQKRASKEAQIFYAAAELAKHHGKLRMARELRELADRAYSGCDPDMKSTYRKA